MKKQNLEIGQLGENMAKNYLQSKGYIIIDQNYRNKYAEIDLITRDKNKIVFIEVKTRIGERFGRPEDAINKNKTFRLVRNAQAYMAYKHNSCAYRIDVICIVLDGNKEIKRIDHYENITG